MGCLATVFTLQALVSTPADFRRRVGPCAAARVRVVRTVRVGARAAAITASARIRQAELAHLASLLIAGGMYVRRPQVREALQLGQEPRIGLMPAAGAGFIEDNDLPGPVFNQQAWGG